MSTSLKVSNPDGSPIDPNQVSFDGMLGGQNYSGTMGELGTRNPDGSLSLSSGDPNFIAPPDPVVTPDPYTPGTITPGTTPPLSDQGGVLGKGVTGIQGAGATAQTGIQGATVGDVEYGGIDAEKLKKQAAIDSGDSYVSPNSLVGNQMQNLLDSDSDYMKTAVRRSDEKAASLGLLGSSMAVGAGERAAREGALEIAKADAMTYAKANLEEQRSYNAISEMKAEGDVSAVAREHIFDIDVESKKLGASLKQYGDTAAAEGNLATQSAIQEMGARWDVESKAALSNLDAYLQIQVDNNQITAAERSQASAQSHQIMAGTYGTISDFLANPDFMAGFKDNPEGLSTFLNQFLDFGVSQTEFTGASLGLPEEYNSDIGYGG